MTSGASDALPLRVASYVLETDKEGLARVLVVLEFDTSRLTMRPGGERQTGAVELTLLGMSRDSGKMFPLDERVQVDVGAKAAGGWMSLTRELRLPAGIAQVRALVRDVTSGLGGTVTERVEVPALDAPYVATPIVTDQMIMAPGKGPRLVPVAYRRFRPKGFLYCSYEVFGMTNAKGEATTHVTGGFTLRDSKGQIVRQASPTPIAVALGGKVIRMLALPWPGSNPGSTTSSSTSWTRAPVAPCNRARPSCWNPPPRSAPFGGAMLPRSVQTSAKALIAAAALSRVASGQEPATVPSFPTQAEAITADVVVLDKDGRPVRGLTRQDFTLLEDGEAAADRRLRGSRLRDHGRARGSRQ